MGWPQLDDFRWAIQEPTNCFTDPELQAGEIVCDMFGMPKMASGNFACAYEVRCGNKVYAIRTFNHEVTDQQLRYQLVSEHLGVIGLPYVVRFQFQPEGLLLGGQSYPIVKMAWVDGMTMTRWVKEHKEDSETIKELARSWRGMIGALYGLSVAHADLQQGNVMVTADGNFKLIDYDGMYVPSMYGKSAPELGHPSWNHPKRSAETFGPYLDQFPGLVGYLSLQAVAAQPALIDEYCTDENIILSQSDLSAPRNSAVIHQLKTISENGVKELTEALINWCDNDVDYDTLENIATGGASPPMLRIGARPAGTRAASAAQSAVESSSKKPYLWGAVAVILIGMVGAWGLFFREAITPPSPSVEVDPPAEVETETFTGEGSPLPKTSEPPANRVTFPIEETNARPAPSASLSSSASPPSPPIDNSVEDELEEKTTELPIPEPKAADVAVSDPVETDRRTAAPEKTFEFDTASEFYSRGQQRVGIRDWVGAGSDFSNAITLASSEPTYFRERGNVRLRQSDLIGAKLDYDKAIKLDPRYSAAYNSRGVLRRRQGDLASARSDYDRAIALNPIGIHVFSEPGQSASAIRRYAGVHGRL